MGTEKATFDEEPIPAEVFNLINEYVEESVRLIKEEDPETAEFYVGHESDFRTYQYKFLRWLKKTESLSRVLYAGSGYDDLPKYVFGEDKVVHTSLEKYKGDPEEYFPILGKGKKIEAENKELPFAISTFDAVLFFGLPEEIISEQIPDAARTLKPGGVIVFGSSMLCEIDIDDLDGFEKIEVPDEYKSAGESEAKFLVFRKIIPSIEVLDEDTKELVSEEDLLLNEANGVLQEICGEAFKIESLPKQLSGTESLRGKNILMIDDQDVYFSEFVAPLLVETEGKAKFIIHLDQTDTELVEAIIEQNPEILLLDSKLKNGIKGSALVTMLKEKGFEGKIVCFSTDILSAPTEFKKAGANNFVRKDYNNLDSVIREIAEIASVAI